MTDHERAATAAASGTGPGPGPDTPGEAAPGSPRFRRDRRHKMVAGVCAGLGRHTEMDPVIYRITLAVLAAAGGIGLIFYGFAWLFIPSEDEEENEVRKLLTGRVDGQALAAVLFALVGCGVFLTMLRNGGVLTFAVVLSLLLAGAGYWSQRRGTPDPDPLAAQAVADAPPEAQAPPAASCASWWRDPIVKDGTHVGGTGYLWGPDDSYSYDRDLAAAVNISRGASRSSREELRPAPPRPRGPRWIGGWIFLLALLAGGLATGSMWHGHPLGTCLQAGLAAALLVFGLGMAVSSVLGRTGAGSVFLAVVTAALLAGASAVPKDISTHWIRTSWKPVSAVDVRPSYQLGTGEATLDLTGVRVGSGRTVTTEAEVGAGKLRVIVPPEVTVRLSIDVGVGDIQLPGEDKKDVDVAPGRHKDVTLSPTAGSGTDSSTKNGAKDGTKNGKDRGTLEIGLRVGVGQAEVSRASS